MAERVLCGSPVLVEGGQALRFTARVGDAQVPAFAIRYQGRVYAYVNECAHIPVELDLNPGRVFDASGHFDLFNVSGLAGSAVSIRGLGPVSGHAYAPGAFVAETQIRTYYLDAPAHQLRQYDGDATDTPVIDDVSGFSVEYFGTPDPPHAPMPILGTANCLYDTGGRLQPGLQVLASRTDGLATLPLGLLSDGPWCGTGGTQFDADLLRVRRVRVTLGVRDSSSTQRLADLVASFDVAPRNLRAVD